MQAEGHRNVAIVTIVVGQKGRKTYIKGHFIIKRHYCCKRQKQFELKFALSLLGVDRKLLVGVGGQGATLGAAPPRPT